MILLQLNIAQVLQEIGHHPVMGKTIEVEIVVALSGIAAVEARILENEPCP